MKTRFRVGFGKTLVLQVLEKYERYWDDEDCRYRGPGSVWRDAKLQDLEVGDFNEFVTTPNSKKG